MPQRPGPRGIRYIPQQEARRRLKQLSPNEREVMELWARGEKEIAIATMLSLPFSTVRTRLTRARAKLGGGEKATVVQVFNLGKS